MTALRALRWIHSRKASKTATLIPQEPGKERILCYLFEHRRTVGALDQSLRIERNLEMKRKWIYLAFGPF